MLGRNLDNAFPPFVPGVPTKSVYERAGFDVNKQALARKALADNKSLSDTRSITSRQSRTATGVSQSNAPSYRNTPPADIHVPPRGLLTTTYSMISESPTTPMTPAGNEGWSSSSMFSNPTAVISASDLKGLPPIKPPPVPDSHSRRNSAASSIYDDSHDPTRESLPAYRVAIPQTKSPVPALPPLSSKRSSRAARSSLAFANNSTPEFQLPASPANSRSSQGSQKSASSFQFDDQAINHTKNPSLAKDPLPEHQQLHHSITNNNLTPDDISYPRDSNHHGLGLDFNDNHATNNQAFSDYDIPANQHHPEDAELKYDDFDDRIGSQEPAHEHEAETDPLNFSQHTSTSTVATSISSEYQNDSKFYKHDTETGPTVAPYAASRMSALSAASFHSTILPLSVNKTTSPVFEHNPPQEVDELMDPPINQDESFNFNDHPQHQHQIQHQYSEPRVRYTKPTASLKSKKHCRGCALRITGKCVSAKDGQISGKWHRECFKCDKCQDLLGSEFYVLDDAPFCYQCYHEDNNSICPSCGLGIEGECLESMGLDSSSELIRYHPQCLCCYECGGLIQQDEYYTMDGMPYCAQHKFNGGSRMEKRKSRFMFM